MSRKCTPTARSSSNLWQCARGSELFCRHRQCAHSADKVYVVLRAPRSRQRSHAPSSRPPPADRQSLRSCEVRRNSRAGGRQRSHHAAMDRMRILTVFHSVIVRNVETVSVTPDNVFFAAEPSISWIVINMVNGVIKYGIPPLTQPTRSSCL